MTVIDTTALAPIRRAVVLGAGTMGAQIAAHLANAGVQVWLLDIPAPDGPRNALVERGLQGAIKADPAAFFAPDLAALVRIGNLDDDLALAANADWVIEAIVENLEIKRSLFARLEAHLSPETVVSTNTSGIPVRSLAEGRSASFRANFLGTHFFNPPRYMHLLELIPGPETRAEVVERIGRFCDVALGKGVVPAKDTPNFIANRIGIFGAMRTLQAFREEGLALAEVDDLTGPAIGRPKSATFRTFDLVGLDVVVHVARNIYQGAPEDERRGVFLPPAFMERMVAEKRLGDKTGGGFYKKTKGADGKSEILALDLETFEYRPQAKVRLPALEASRQVEDLGERLRMLVLGKDKAASFLQKTLLETLAYAAARVPEIADRVEDVDHAMEWGFGWSKGPFETWDLLGIERTLPLLAARDLGVPKLVQDLLASGRKSFYVRSEGVRRYFDLSGNLRESPARPGVVVLASRKERGGLIKQNSGASLVDLGDGVLCVEFHSKMNAIGGDTIGMLQAGVEALRESFDAMVVANDGENFSVGANLMLLLLEAQEGNFDEIDLIVRQFQQANMLLKTAPKPVVVAPFGMTLGGGLEVTLHGAAVQAAAETYMGLVEVGVGLIPAGGGTKELLLRQYERAGEGIDLFPLVRAAFETIGMAKVAKSTVEARKLGFLRSGDGVTMNRERLTEDAKTLALALARRGYRPQVPLAEVPVLGSGALATLKLGLHQMKRGGYISEYDAHLGEKLAHILTGGSLSRVTRVSEQRLLDLEREAFLSLCGERRTLERIQHMLKTGKPLRN